LIEHGGDAIAEGPVVHEHLGVGVHEQGGELTGFVAEVHVRRERSQLRAREQTLEVLGTVVEVEGDVVAGSDTGGLQRARELRGSPLEIPPGDAAVALHHRGRIGDRARHRLPDRGEAVVQLPRP
jgi:hypothetical protein